MSDTLSVTKPPGLFKRETKGLSTDPVTVQLERGAVRLFSRLLGETDPIFTDSAAARAKGYLDIVAPPSFATVVEALATDERRRQGAHSLADLVGCDFRYLLHGEQHYVYRGLLYAGDEVSVSSKVLDFYDKRDGLLEFVVLETTIFHAVRGVVVSGNQTLLHRLG